MSLVARPLRLATTDSGFDAALAARLHWSADTDAGIEQAVADILADVRQRGDAAVLEYTNRFDMKAGSMAELQLRPASSRPPSTACRRSSAWRWKPRPPVRSYHEAQKRACGESWSYRDDDGTPLGQKVTRWTAWASTCPAARRLSSSCAMNAIPAQVAGVAEIVMVVPTPRGEKNPLVLAAAHVAGVTRVFTIGGAQAAVLAYGTETVPRVDKIGPAMPTVAAKRRVFGQVGIDMIAGRRDPAWPTAPRRPTGGDGPVLAGRT